MTTYGTVPTSPVGASKIESLTRASESVKAGLGTRRPWKVMFNLDSINLPLSFSEALPRIKTNTGYFRMNYAMIVLLVLFLSLLWNPISLIVLTGLMAAWLFLYFLRDEPVTIFHSVIDDRLMLIFLVIVTIILLSFTGVTLNIVLSILTGLVLVLIHAVLRKTEDLNLDGAYLVASSS